MATTHFIVEERISQEHGTYLFQGYAVASDDEPEFSVFYELRSQERYEFKLELRFVATNPIGIDDILIGTATTYGLCIASKLTRQTAKEAIKCYRHSKNMDPSRTVLDHAKEAAKCLASKGSVLKDTASDALIDCLKIRDDDKDGD